MPSGKSELKRFLTDKCRWTPTLGHRGLSGNKLYKVCLEALGAGKSWAGVGNVAGFAAVETETVTHTTQLLLRREPAESCRDIHGCRAIVPPVARHRVKSSHRGLHGGGGSIMGGGERCGAIFCFLASGADTAIEGLILGDARLT